MDPQFAFIHGWASAPQIWQPLQTQLSFASSVSFVSLPWVVEDKDEGNSFFPLEDYFDALAVQLEQANVIVGWSLGGLLAAGYVDRSPDWQGHLVLIAAPLKFAAQSASEYGIDADLLNRFCTEFDRSPQQVIDRFIALQTMGDEYASTCRQMMRTVLQYQDEMRDSLAEGLTLLQKLDYRSVLSKTASSITMIHGENDQVVPWQASKQLCIESKEAVLHRIADSGHAPHVSHPEQVANILRTLCADRVCGE